MVFMMQSCKIMDRSTDSIKLAYIPYKAGGSTLALIFRKSWFITARFHSIHLRAYFSQVNVTIALIVFYWQPGYQFQANRRIY